MYNCEALDKYKLDDGYTVQFDDERQMYYVLHRNKRLYYPRTFSRDSASAWYNLFSRMEQDEMSPHRYIDESINAYKNGVVVELGAAEGSFSLDLVEDAKEIYLFECDDKWIEALEATFAPYRNVHIIKKLVSDKNRKSWGGEQINLNTALASVAEDVSVIKMDIEGYEAAALKGASDILHKAKHLMILACVYHRAGDEDEVRRVLGGDFDIEARHGYMLFHCDKKLKVPYFRHGVLKCTRNALAESNSG